MYGNDATICEQTSGQWRVWKDLLNFGLPRGFIDWARIQNLKRLSIWSILLQCQYAISFGRWGPYEPACLTATPLALTEQDVGVGVGVGTADRRESPLQPGKRAREYRIDPSLRLIYDGQGRFRYTSDCRVRFKSGRGHPRPVANEELPNSESHANTSTSGCELQNRRCVDKNAWSHIGEGEQESANEAFRYCNLNLLQPSQELSGLVVPRSQSLVYPNRQVLNGRPAAR